MEKTYLRGELYYADLGRCVGSEQEGYRPVVIIQNDMGNRHSPTVIVAAISSRIRAKRKLPTHYYMNAENGLKEPSVILLEQIRTIDKQRLDQRIGRLSEKHLAGLNHALAVSVGLIEPTPQKMTLCLCSTCANNFYGTGDFVIKRINPNALEKDSCTYCGQRQGYDYIVEKRERK